MPVRGAGPLYSAALVTASPETIAFDWRARRGEPRPEPRKPAPAGGSQPFATASSGWAGAAPGAGLPGAARLRLRVGPRDVLLLGDAPLRARAGWLLRSRRLRRLPAGLPVPALA